MSKADERAAKSSAPDTGAGTPARKAVVLVVDDEPAIRMPVSRYLRFKGFETVEAGDGEEAMAVLESRAWAVDLLLTDMVMPRMSGRELIRHVRARSATGIPVLCMSGHLEAPKEEEHEPWGRLHVVAKPFELEELARRVARALAPPQSA